MWANWKAEKAKEQIYMTVRNIERRGRSLPFILGSRLCNETNARVQRSVFFKAPLTKEGRRAFSETSSPRDFNLAWKELLEHVGSYPLGNCSPKYMLANIQILLKPGLH